MVFSLYALKGESSYPLALGMFSGQIFLSLAHILPLVLALMHFWRVRQDHHLVKYFILRLKFSVDRMWLKDWHEGVNINLFDKFICRLNQIQVNDWFLVDRISITSWEKMVALYISYMSSVLITTGKFERRCSWLSNLIKPL